MEPGFRFLARPQVGKLVVACRWLSVDSTEPLKTVCTGFLCPPYYQSVKIIKKIIKKEYYFGKVMTNTLVYY